MIYKLLNIPDQVLRLSDMTYVPFDEGNKDYQEYLGWLASGNTPEPADISPIPEPIYQWESFSSQLISVIEGSAYRQLTDWAKTLPAFGDCKANLIFAINNQNVLSIQYLQFALADLKQTTEAPNIFTDLQITEIDSCLTTLGVDWRWEDL